MIIFCTTQYTKLSIEMYSYMHLLTAVASTRSVDSFLISVVKIHFQMARITKSLNSPIRFSPGLYAISNDKMVSSVTRKYEWYFTTVVNFVITVPKPFALVLHKSINQSVPLVLFGSYFVLSIFHSTLRLLRRQQHSQKQRLHQDSRHLK